MPNNIQGRDPTYNVRELIDSAVGGLEKLLMAESRRLDAALDMHIKYTQLLGEAETKRIDSNRGGDMEAVALANAQAIATAGVLATQVTVSADALRTLVANTATTVALELQQMSKSLADRIAALEKTAAMSVGVSSASPNMQLKIEELEAALHESKGRSGLSAPILMLLSGAAVGLLVFVLETIVR